MYNTNNNALHWVTEPTDEIAIRLGTTAPASDPPTTVMTHLYNTARTYPTREALCVKREGQWVRWTFATYLSDVESFAKSLLSLGLERGDGVSIIGFNAPEWVIANLGSIFTGALPAGIYSTNGPDACKYVAVHSNAAVIVVEDPIQLEKFLTIREALPSLKALVMWSGVLPTPCPANVYHWDEFLTLGKHVKTSDMENRIASIKPGHCCSLIYTSGTTGNPKAVMLSHDNITWTAKQGVATMYSTIDPTANEARNVSYLPLSHVAAQLVDIHAPILLASTTYFAQPDALKGSLVDTLMEVQPSSFLGVPRVWEKIQEKMQATGASNSAVKQHIGDWAKTLGLEGTLAKLKGQELPWGWTLANTLVFSNVKKALGLEKAVACFTAAAPISRTTLDYFASLDLPILEVYGMSECTGPHTVNTPDKCQFGTVGTVLDGVELKLASPDAKGEGEICMRGRNIFMGYLHNPDATAATIDANGWLHSGDLGKLTPQGFLKITGRIKELIITAGGENIAPVLIEDAIKVACPSVSNAMVVGDQRKYLVVLLTLKSEVDPISGAPSDTPAPVTVAALQECGSSATTLSQARNCPLFKKLVEVAIENANTHAISRAHHVRKWALLPGDFTLESGELTPTMKLKRRIVMENHATVISSLYPEERPPMSQMMAKL